LFPKGRGCKFSTVCCYTRRSVRQNALKFSADLNPTFSQPCLNKIGTLLPNDKKGRLFRKTGRFMQFSTLSIFFIFQDRPFVNITNIKELINWLSKKQFFMWPSTLLSRSNDSWSIFDHIDAYISYILHPNVKKLLLNNAQFVLNISIFLNFWKIHLSKRNSGAIFQLFAVIPEEVSSEMH